MVERAYNQPGYQNPITGLWGSEEYVFPANQLIIIGEGAGTKASPPITWELFGGSVGQLVSEYDSSWVPYAGEGALITDVNPRFPGHKSAYNNPARNPTPGGNSQFWTNYKTNLARKGRTRYVSYRVYVNYREGYELGGQIKFARVTSSAASGGGGVYNGAGAQILNAPAPESWQGGWVGSDGVTGTSTGYLEGAWFPSNRWVHIEYECYLSDVDATDGFFTIGVAHEGTRSTGPIMQRYSGYGAASTLLFDTLLLGLEVANPEHWYTPNSLTANTDYTISATNLSATNYTATWASGGTVPTAAEVVNGLKAELIAQGMPSGDIRSNPDNLDEFGLYWGYETVTVSANLSRSNPMSVQQSETYEDDDFRQVFIGDSPVWASCTEYHPQPRTLWEDTVRLFDVYFGGITGQKWAFDKLAAGETPVLIGEVVPRSGGGWEIAS